MQFPLKAPPGERAASRPQKLSTKLPGKRPVLPFLCNVPLYQPSSRFLCTNTMSPSFSSISASLCGGYGTTTRYLWRQNRKDLVSQRSSPRRTPAARQHAFRRLCRAETFGSLHAGPSPRLHGCSLGCAGLRKQTGWVSGREPAPRIPGRAP